MKTNIENQMLVIFGASGDLTARKLIPALFSMFKAGALPERFVVVGTSRSRLTDEAFRQRVVTQSAYMNGELQTEAESMIRAFTDMIFYEPLEEGYEASYATLGERLKTLS